MWLYTLISEDGILLSLTASSKRTTFSLSMTACWVLRNSNQSCFVVIVEYSLCVASIVYHTLSNLGWNITKLIDKNKRQVGVRIFAMKKIDQAHRRAICEMWWLQHDKANFSMKRISRRMFFCYKTRKSGRCCKLVYTTQHRYTLFIKTNSWLNAPYFYS